MSRIGIVVCVMVCTLALQSCDRTPDADENVQTPSTDGQADDPSTVVVPEGETTDPTPTANRLVPFTTLVGEVSSFRISAGCVFFMGDSLSGTNVSMEFCSELSQLPGNIADSAIGLTVSDGQCPLVTLYRDRDFGGPSEEINFCAYEEFSQSCSNCQ